MLNKYIINTLIKNQYNFVFQIRKLLRICLGASQNCLWFDKCKKCMLQHGTELSSLCQVIFSKWWIPIKLK